MSETELTPALWTGQDMLDAIDARPVHGLPNRVDGISIDTRTLQPGDAFFAIAGDNTDGHKYATAAAGAGASVLVVSEDKLAALGRITIPLMVVRDVLDALRRLAMAARARTKARIVAITGSAGKTTTKDALRHILSAQGPTHASAASYNNHWGVPLTLARMPADTRFGIFEIGMNHHNEITPLVGLVRPHVSVVTLIAAAHLGNFSDLDDIAKAKAEIFSGLVKGGTALINRDDARFDLLSTFATDYGVDTVAGFGEHKQADVRLVAHALHADCSTLKANVFGKEIALKIGIPGRHVVQNMLGALGVVSLLGGDIDRAGIALQTLGASPGRGQHFKLRVGRSSAVLIDESYNANPASVAAAMHTMANMEPHTKTGRRIAILGDMLEMGDFAEREHAALADPVRASGVDVVYLAGEAMKALAEALGDDVPVHYYQKTDDLKAGLKKALRAGDIVTVKSSNGVGFSRIVKALKQTYPPIKD